MIAGFAIGILLGAGATSLVVWWHVRKLRSTLSGTSDERPVLLKEDRTVTSDQFAAHAVAVQRQVSEYADVLAGDDPILREQLRRIEIGMQL